MSARVANLAARQAQTLLEQVTGSDLLTTFAALTHRIHAAERAEAPVSTDLRLQRDMVRGEILRRMGERIEP